MQGAVKISKISRNLRKHLFKNTAKSCVVFHVLFKIYNTSILPNLNFQQLILLFEAIFYILIDLQGCINRILFYFNFLESD